MSQRNVHRPGFEPGTPWSEIRRPNHCATPSYCFKSYKYAMTRNSSNQSPNPALKTKWEITKIIKSQNINRIYGQPSEQLFPKRLPLSNPDKFIQEFKVIRRPSVNIFKWPSLKLCGRLTFHISTCIINKCFSAPRLAPASVRLSYVRPSVVCQPFSKIFSSENLLGFLECEVM